jgi:hypothetical protein
MRSVAEGFLNFGAVAGLADDDDIVERWATAVDPLEVAPELDPYVGAVSGIGIALFCYMRVRRGDRTRTGDPWSPRLALISRFGLSSI